MYEDDGESLGYRTGQFARTLLTCETVGKTVKLIIDGRKGSYAGMPASRDFSVTIHLPAQPKTVTLDGVAVLDYQWDDKTSVATIHVPACGTTAKVLTCERGQ